MVSVQCIKIQRARRGPHTRRRKGLRVAGTDTTQRNGTGKEIKSRPQGARDQSATTTRLSHTLSRDSRDAKREGPHVCVTSRQRTWYASLWHDVPVRTTRLYDLQSLASSPPGSLPNLPCFPFCTRRVHPPYRTFDSIRTTSLPSYPWRRLSSQRA